MDSVVDPNVDIEDPDDGELNVNIEEFLTLKEPGTTKRADVKWRCSDFALTMLEEGIGADLRFFPVFDDSMVKAHTSVLTCVCPNFVDSIDVRMSTEALKLFLLLLYTTNEGDDVVVPELIDAINDHFEELFEAVTKYDVERRLGFVLLPALARFLTPKNCWKYYRYSLRAKHLPYKISCAEICYDYIRDNYDDVVKANTLQAQMKRSNEKVQLLLLHAESQASRQELFHGTDNRADRETS